MTKLWIASDLHHGYGDTITPRAPAHDVYVCAGDFARLDDAIGMLTSGVYGNGITVLVPGNHEYYGTVIEDAERAGADLAGGTKVFLLNPGEVILGDIRFLGCTLWTDYNLFGDRAAAMVQAWDGLNDHRLIKTREGCRPGWSRQFKPEDALRRHERELAWLDAQLAIPFEGPSVVVTHHGPSPRSVPERFRHDPMTPAFYSDIEALVLQHQPDLWIHGHTHDSFYYTIGRTRVICNPAGYSHEPNRGYKWDLVVDLPAHGLDDEPPAGISP
jgi:hypothetical protein